MERYKRFFAESDIKVEAFEWVQKFTLTSKTEAPPKDIINYLQTYPKKIDIIYRGIGLVYSRIDHSKIDELNSLKIGDNLPQYLTRQTGVSSYTKKLPLAKKYSEGQKSIIVEAKNINTKNIILDLEIFAKECIKTNETFFDKEDLNYMIRDKEVIILEPIETFIIDIKGRL
jgi:hypothetical protein